jgi:hypothetical protein
MCSVPPQNDVHVKSARLVPFLVVICYFELNANSTAYSWIKRFLNFPGRVDVDKTQRCNSMVNAALNFALLIRVNIVQCVINDITSTKHFKENLVFLQCFNKTSTIFDLHFINKVSTILRRPLPIKATGNIFDWIACAVHSRFEKKIYLINTIITVME